MDHRDLVHRYLEAWNRHEPDSIAALFGAEGTFSDPSTGTALSGPQISAHAGRLFTTLPDAAFDLVSVLHAGEGRITLQWLLHGTADQAIMGSAEDSPSRSVTLPGVDILAVDDEHIRTTLRYFDRQAFQEQLGFQIVLQPPAVAPFSFGTSLRITTDKRSRPGALSITWIDLRSDEDRRLLEEYGSKVSEEMQTLPGFLGFLDVLAGSREYTLAAWEDVADARQLMRSPPHLAAMKRFFGPTFAGAVHTSVWVPHHLNPLWIRCSACDRVVDDAKAGGRCPCGQALPDPPPYF
jgi:steroid delta-isomerase-like uncharacterized protein